MSEPLPDPIPDGMTESEFLDAIAPRQEPTIEEDRARVRMDNHSLVQGCASCGYDPDACGCNLYPKEELL